jgi:phage baseplate assembly protein W
MAIKIGNLPAIDQQPAAIGVGLGIPFSSIATSGSDSIFRINYTTADQIKSNMINYFLHIRGERPLNPDFGGILSDFLFEPNSTLSNEIVKNYIQNEIISLFPVVKLKEINVTPNLDYNIITIQISYSVFASLNEFIELNIPL